MIVFPLFRIGYSVFLLKEILKKKPGQVVIMYDIACLLFKHLKVETINCSI